MRFLADIILFYSTETLGLYRSTVRTHTWVRGWPHTHIQSRFLYLWPLYRIQAENNLLYIPRCQVPTTRNLQEIVLCLVPRLVIVHIADLRGHLA